MAENSRKNKLQRCSVCGGLGHKSRTCPDNNTHSSSSLTEACSPTWGSEQYGFTSWSDDDPFDDAQSVRAAYGLITLSLSHDESFGSSTCCSEEEDSKPRWKLQKCSAPTQQSFENLALPPGQQYGQVYWRPLMA